MSSNTAINTNLIIPEGFEFSHVEDNVIQLKKKKTPLPESWEELTDVSRWYPRVRSNNSGRCFSDFST